MSRRFVNGVIREYKKIENQHRRENARLQKQMYHESKQYDAECDTVDLIKAYDSYDHLVQSQYEKGDLFFFEAYKKEYIEKKFISKLSKPKKREVVPTIPILNKAPKESFLEKLFPKLRIKRLRIEEENQQLIADSLKHDELEEKKAVEDFESATEKYIKALEVEKQEFQMKEKKIRQSVDQHNLDIENWQIRFNIGEEEAVKKFVQEVLELYHYGITLINESHIDFVRSSRRLYITMYLKSRNDVFGIGGFKYYKTRNEISPTKMKVGEMNDRFKRLLVQLSASLIQIVFDNDNEVINEIFLDFYSENLCIASTSIDYLSYKKYDLRTLHGISSFVNYHMRVYKQYNRGVESFISKTPLKK